MRRFSALILGCAVVVAASAGARAATSNVSIQGFAFLPSSITIDVGDTVKWTNNDPFTHTVTSDSNAFPEGTLGGGAVYPVTFSSAGTFGYSCRIHTSMTGTVIVKGPTPPTAPRNLSAAPGSGLGQVALSWTAPASGDATTYTIFRGTSSGSETKLGTTSQTAFTDSGALLTTYFYKVTASNTVGEGPASNEACSKPFPWLALLGC